MQKKFITNLAFLLFLNILVKPFWILGIDRTVQNTVGAESYGHYYALFNFSFLLNILLDLGITNFNNKNIAQNTQLLNKHLSGIIALRMLLAGIYVLVSMLNALVIGYRQDEMQMLIILLLNQVLISFILYLRSNITGLHLFKTDSVISVLDRLLMILFCGLLLWGNLTSEPFRIEWFVYVQTLAYFITASVSFLIVARKAKFEKLSWHPAFFLLILKQSYPYAILILLMTFYNRIDSVMIERLLDNGKREAGIYAQAYRLLDAANMIAYLFSAILLPVFSRMIKLKQPTDELLRLSYCLLVIPAFLLGIISFFYRNPIMDLLYVEHVQESSVVFGILMISFSAICTTYIFGTLLTANGNLRQLNYMAAGGMLLNVIMNFILIPRYAAAGAAFSSLATQFFTATVQVYLSYRLLKLKYDFGFYLRVAILLLLTILLSYWIYGMQLNWMHGFLISGIIAFSAAIALKVIRPASLLLILRQE